MPAGADAVLDFWFGAHSDELADAARQRLWFAGDAATDRDIAARFGALVERALRGDLAAWAGQARSLLALIIVLDQFPRNIFRGSARAFEGDARALALAADGVRRGLDATLRTDQRIFFYLPFEHSERLADQQRSVALLSALADDAPAPARALVQSSLRYALRHRDIIARFGRFPHRNRPLGRTDTAAEAEWLRDGGDRFGQ